MLGYRPTLKERGQAYLGRLLRLVAEAPDKYPHLVQKRLIFVGFNQLSAAEKKFICYAISEHGAEVHWDTDSFYIENPNHEAGLFLRSHQKDASLGATFPNPLPSRLQQARTIHVHMAPNPISQAKAAAAALQDYLQSGTTQHERIAIVLPEEEMLMPLLHALPKCKINITMGYRLSATPLRELLQCFLAVYTQRSEGIRLPDWRALLLHPYLLPFCVPLPDAWHLDSASERLRIASDDPLLQKCPDFLCNAVFGEEDLLGSLQLMVEGLLLRAEKAGASHFNRLEQAYFSGFLAILGTLRRSAEAEGLVQILDQLSPRGQGQVLESLVAAAAARLCRRAAAGASNLWAY